MVGSCEYGWELTNVVKEWNLFTDHPPASNCSHGQLATQLRSADRLLSAECTYTCFCSHSKLGLRPLLREHTYRTGVTLLLSAGRLRPGKEEYLIFISPTRYDRRSQKCCRHQMRHTIARNLYIIA